MSLKKTVINDYELSYIEKGAGPPLILVHGSLGDYRSWHNQLEIFSNKYRTIAVSLRHCFPEIWDGKNGKFTMTQHVEDLIEFIEKLKLSDVHILGHSRGAAIVLKLLCDYEYLFRSAILADPAPLNKLFENNSEILHELEKRNRFVNKSLYSINEGNIDRGLEIFTDFASLPGTWKNLAEEGKEIRRNNAWSIKSLAQDADESINIENIKQLKQQILLISGRYSPRIYKIMHKKLESLIPNVQKRVISNASHGMHREQSESFNSAVLDFLNNFPQPVVSKRLVETRR